MARPAGPAGYNVRQVLARRDRLAAALTGALEGSRAAAALDRAAAAAFRFFGGRLDYAALCQTVAVLVDPTVTVRDLAWAIAGNARALAAARAAPGPGVAGRRGVAPIRPGRFPAEPAWVPAQVLAVRSRSTPTGPGVLLRLRVLAGPGCPGVFELAWSLRAARYYGSHPKVFGLARDRPTRYRQPADLVRCRVRLEIAAGADGRVEVRRLAAGVSLVEHNQALARLRRREDGFSCPKNYTHPCARCPVGYDACPAGTHPTGWTPVRPCGRCGKTGWSDPDWEDGRLCLRCLGETGGR